MKLDEAINKLEERGYLVEAMTPEEKKVRKANRELAYVESLSDFITVLQKLNQDIPDAYFKLGDKQFSVTKTEDGEIFIYLKEKESDWRMANYR